MKKNTLILLMFMSICSVYGQAGFSLSIKGGAGISNLVNFNFLNKNRKMGFGIEKYAVKINYE